MKIKKKIRRKKKRRKRFFKNWNRKEKSLAASHPSVKGQRPQERWIGAHWESQEANPLPSIVFRLRSALPVTGVLAVGGVVENRFCTRGPYPRLDYVQNPSLHASEHATSTSRQNRVQIQYIFEPQPAESDCARRTVLVYNTCSGRSSPGR